MKILCICLSSGIQRTLSFENFCKGQVNRTSDFIENLSGKAVNTARVISQHKEQDDARFKKLKVSVLCPEGKDNKAQFKFLAQKESFKVKTVTIKGRTRQCWTLLEKDGTTTEVIADEKAEENLRNIYIEAQGKILSKLERLTDRYRTVVFAGSCPSYFDADFPAKICRIVKNCGCRLLADFTGTALTETLKVCTPDIIKINQEEFTSTFMNKKSSQVSFEELKKAVAEKSEELNNIVIVTRGEESTVSAEKGQLTVTDCEKLVPVNTTGCGDSFNAGFISEYVLSGNLEEALKLGTWCASRNAESLCPGSLK